MPWIKILQRAIVLVAGFASIAPAGALVIDENLLFRANGQSQWTGGAPVNIGTGGLQFFGIEGFHEGFSVGGFFDPCPVFSCDTGARIGAEISGRAGLYYDVNINSGSLAITFPQRMTLSIPDPAAVLLGAPFEITSTLGPTTIWTFTNVLSPIGGGQGRK